MSVRLQLFPQTVGRSITVRAGAARPAYIRSNLAVGRPSGYLGYQKRQLHFANRLSPLLAVFQDDTAPAVSEVGAEDLAKDEAAVATASSLPEDSEDGNELAGTAVTSDPATQAWRASWTALLQSALDKGFFGERTASLQDVGPEFGPIKRALLAAGRARGDIIYSLPEQLVVDLIGAAAKVETDDRKVKNSVNRLKATFVDKQSLDVGLGGEATTLDLVRIFMYTTIQSNSASSKVTEVLEPANAVLTQVLTLLQAEPEPQAAAKAAEVQKEWEVFQEQTRARQGQRSGGRRDGSFDGRRDGPFDGFRQDRQRQQGNFQGGFQRAPRQGPDVKPGDWFCAACNQHNFARNSECLRCGDARSNAEPVGVSDERVQQMDYFRGGRDMGSRRQPGVMPGDWFCPNCNAHNFASKTACYRCSCEKGDTAPVPGAMGNRGRQDDGRRPTQSPRPGDWYCSDCNFHNFAFKSECKRCGANKGSSRVVQDDEGGSGSGMGGYEGGRGGRSGGGQRFGGYGDRGGGGQRSGGYSDRGGGGPSYGGHRDAGDRW